MNINLNQFDPFCLIYSIGRSLLALSLLLTLCLNSATQLISLEFEYLKIGNFNLNLFQGFHLYGFNIGYLFALTILFFVIIGYRPRFTGILHYWVTLSFINSCLVIDGGDQINSNLTLLLSLLTLLDNRKWHWIQSKNTNKLNHYHLIFLFSVIVVIKLQISTIYFQAATSKFSVSEWLDGSAVYYWFTHELHGMPSWLTFLLSPYLSSEIFVSSLTWGALLLELMLFVSPLLTWPIRKTLLFLGIGFHACIIFVHGLPTFFITMSVALLFLLSPWMNNNKPLNKYGVAI